MYSWKNVDHMDIGLYFGSFNPIHHGHLIIAQHILQSLPLKELWFVVSPQNPFKPSRSLLNENHRYFLVQEAIEGELRMKATNVEFFLPRPSYTATTLAYLREQYPQHRFHLIMGSDAWQNFPNWKNPESILEHHPVIIYKRPGYEVAHRQGNNITVLDAPLLQISSTHIRELVKNGHSIRYFVPDKVMQEIDRNGYYRN